MLTPIGTRQLMPQTSAERGGVSGAWLRQKYKPTFTRRKSGPIETALSGHASAVLRVILTKETLCVAWLLFCISTSSQSKVDEETRAKFRYTSS